MYEAVRARPAGASTVARLAATAADYGYAGLVVANPPDAQPDYDPSAIAEAYDVDVVDGRTLEPTTPAEASGALGHHRPETTVLALRGGGDGLNPYAVRRDRLDVLAGPLADAGSVDDVLVKAAAEHGVRLAVDLGPVLRSSGDERTRSIAGLRKLRELLEDAEAPYVVTASATSHLELRAPRELAAVAAVAGFDREAVEAGLAEWGRLAGGNRERLSDDYVAPGVRRGREADE
jgi:ribonuclease P/MRP protein subunit RPP1